MLTEKGSSVFIGSPVMLIPRSVSQHRPGVRDDQPSQYDTNDWFSIENESQLLCSLAVISLRIPWDRVYLVGQVFFVLELAQQPLLIILFGVSERGYLRVIGRG